LRRASHASLSSPCPRCSLSGAQIAGITLGAAALAFLVLASLATAHWLRHHRFNKVVDIPDAGEDGAPVTRQLKWCLRADGTREVLGIGSFGTVSLCTNRSVPCDRRTAWLLTHRLLRCPPPRLQVYRAMLDNQPVAVKVIRGGQELVPDCSSAPPGRAPDPVTGEIATLRACHSDHVVAFHGEACASGSKGCSGQCSGRASGCNLPPALSVRCPLSPAGAHVTQEETLVIMEYRPGGSLYQAIHRRNKPLSWANG
jgi:hypothetical protein